jgi:UDP-glucuronate 4-epimerase
MDISFNNILVTGAAGFIGFHITTRLLNVGYNVFGLDSINNYYSVWLKYDRLAQDGILLNEIEYNKVTQSSIYPNYKFIKLNVEDKENLEHLFSVEQFAVVIHLAAQAGVRYSIINPNIYMNSNIIGFLNILENCKKYSIKHLVYASSSSVYGLNNDLPLNIGQNTDRPVSLYAASKKANELMAHVYCHLYNFPTTGLRFFTAYGPYGRPDMAFYSFTKAILEDNPIEIFNKGMMLRDYTYIDDLVEGIFRVVFHPPDKNTNYNTESTDKFSLNAPYKIYNIGSGKPIQLMDFINAIENALNKVAIKNYLPEQPGDMLATHADMTEFIRDFNFCPSTSIQTGIRMFVNWYKEYYSIENINEKIS